MLFNAVTVLAVGSSVFVATHALAIDVNDSLAARAIAQDQAATFRQKASAFHSQDRVTFKQGGGIDQFQTAGAVNNNYNLRRPKVDQSQDADLGQTAHVVGTKGPVVVNQGAGIAQTQFGVIENGVRRRPAAVIAQAQDATLTQDAIVRNTGGHSPVNVDQNAAIVQGQFAAVDTFNHRRPASSVSQDQSADLAQTAEVSHSGGAVVINQSGGIRQTQDAGN